MTDESSNPDQWLAQIKNDVHKKVGDNNWDEVRWTEFVKEVACWLHQFGRPPTSIINALVGLINYEVMEQNHLEGISSNQKEFCETLKEKGVRPAICDKLFNKYVAPQQQQQQQPTRHYEEKETPGSEANPSRAALLSLVETIHQTDFAIEWCGGVGNWQRRIKDSQVPAQDFDLLLTNRLGVSMEKIAGGGLDDLDFLNLRKERETGFQQGHLQDKFFNVESAKALDLSNATVDGPFFKPATKVDGDYTVSAKTGKPDGTSMVAPMDLEIKSDLVNSDNLAKIDYEVLEQAVERVCMRMRNLGLLKMAFAFAVTGRSAWFLIVRRDEPMEKAKLWVDRVPHSDVGNMWMCITQLAGQRPGFFLSEDGAAMCTAMNKIGVTAWCCRVEALAQSQSVVYDVTVPKEYKSGGTPLIGIDVAPSSVTYAVKIIRDEATFKTESEALQKIAAKAGPNSSFYALGCVPRNGEATRFHTISEWETGIHYEPTGRFWWDHSFDTVESEGGAIIMRRGIATARRCFRAEDALPNDVCSDLVNSLQLAHSAGILQCDLRRSNFVQFNDSWQLIDYSLSVEVNSQVEYKMEAGAQADCAGNNVKALYKKKAPIQWTKVDDYQMLIANIMSS